MVWIGGHDGGVNHGARGGGAPRRAGRSEHQNKKLGRRTVNAPGKQCSPNAARGTHIGYVVSLPLFNFALARLGHALISLCGRCHVCTAVSCECRESQRHHPYQRAARSTYNCINVRIMGTLEPNCSGRMRLCSHVAGGSPGSSPTKTLPSALSPKAWPRQPGPPPPPPLHPPPFRQSNECTPVAAVSCPPPPCLHTPSKLAARNSKFGLDSQVTAVTVMTRDPQYVPSTVACDYPACTAATAHSHARCAWPRARARHERVRAPADSHRVWHTTLGPVLDHFGPL
jgi:hypothetical protein